MTLLPKESGSFIVQHAQNVSVLNEGVDKLVDVVLECLKSKTLDVCNFSQCALHPRKEDKFAVDWIFVVDTLNFCFWTPGVGNSTKYRVNRQTGYFALCAAINRAMEENIDILNPRYYSQITVDELSSILRSDDGRTVIPLLKERVNCLHQAGKKLLEKFDGTFINVVRTCDNSAQKLLKTIVKEFPEYQDEAMFHGQRVSFYKRAQILIGDIWSCYQGEGIGCFSDIGTVTMFADYRVPQVLVHFGAIAYTDELLDRLKIDQLMEYGCEDEVEIRGASIHIVELVKDKIIKMIKADESLGLKESSINGILIDHFLWDYRRRHAQELDYIPFHKVLCIYY